MLPAILLAILLFTAAREPILDINFDVLPTGAIRSAQKALPHRWVINMKSKVFEIAADFPRPPKDRPNMQKALRYSAKGGWPAGDLYIVWPKAVTTGCLEARALVFLPDDSVPVFVGLTRFNPANWQDTGPAAVMLYKGKEGCWQCGAFSIVCKSGWNYVRVIVDLDRRVSYALVRHENSANEKLIAWEAPIETNGKKLTVNALYLRTDFGYSKGKAYFADLKVQPSKPPELELNYRKADLSHIAPPNQGFDIGGLWDFLPVKEADQNAGRLRSLSEKSPGQVPASSAEGVHAPPAEDAKWLKIVVPAQHYPVMRAYGVTKAWFRRKVKLPAKWKGKLIHVHFGMTRARADIYWNRRRVHTHWEGFSGYSVDVTDAAKPGEENELLVLIYTHDIIQHPDGPLYPLTWYWMYSTGNGICMPVSVEATPALHVSDVFARPSVREGKLRLDVTVENHTHRIGSNESQADLQLRARVLSAGKPVLEFPPTDVTVKQKGTVITTMEADWPNAHLWWPHDPHLYIAHVELHSKGKDKDATPLAARRATFGFRELEVRGPDILLNGKRLQLRRQSLLAYANRWLSKDWFRDHISELRAQRYNCARIHGGVSTFFANEADRLGFLIIPEFCTKSHNLDPVTKPQRFLRGIEHCLGILREQRNHPSIVMWNICNEVYIYSAVRSEEGRQRLARNLDMLGDLVQQLDPTRTVSYDGDSDLNGLAPTASLHYPWQVFKMSRMMPTTRFWLDEGRRPWSGYVWKKDKPLIIGEYFHAPYSLRAPWGLTQFMGDRAFVHPDGWAEGMFRAYRMMDEGYRHARVACLNPWAVPEPVKKLGVLLRPVFIAVKESNRTFWSGEKVERMIYVFNDVLHDRDYLFRWALLREGKKLDTKDLRLPIEAGGMKEIKIELNMPTVRQKRGVRLRLELLLDGKPACDAEVKDFSIFPSVAQGLMTAAPMPTKGLQPKTKLTQQGVIVHGKESCLSKLRSVGFKFATAPDIASALARQPKVLLLAGIGVARDEVRLLLDWVERGGRVVWLDAPASSWLPAGIQVSGSHYAAHAFRTVAEHPTLTGLTDADLKCWRPDDLVCRATFRKPHIGSALAILEAGATPGLDWSPLIEARRGAGSFLLCQMLLTEKVGLEPAATHLLANLLNYTPKPTLTRRPVCVIGGGRNSFTAALKKLKVEVCQNPADASVLVLNCSTPDVLSNEAVRDAAGRVRSGATLLIRSLVPESAARLSEVIGAPISVQPTKLFHLIRRERPKLLDGLSNEDLYWSKKELNRDEPVTEGTTPIVEFTLELPKDSAVQVLTDPPALAILSLGRGRIVLDQIRWAESLEIEAVHAARIGTRLLANLGAKFEPDDAVTKREFAFVDLRGHANRGFQDEVAGDGKGGWTDEGTWDMRYFPVNRTGFDPQGNPMAKETFPAQVHYGGVDFRIVNPETNAGKSCIVLGSADASIRPTTKPIKLNRRADMLWLLHAADGYWNNNTPFEIATLRVSYSDGQTVSAQLVNTKQLHDWRVVAPLSEGCIGWMGRNVRHSPCVLYVWGWRNPRPKQRIASIELQTGKKYRYILVAVTCETR